MFKKFLIGLATLTILTVATVWAVDQFHTANGVKIKWDAVTTYGNNEPIPPTHGTINYVVFRAGLDRSNPVEMWRGPELTTTLTFTEPGKYLLGIKSVLVSEGIDVAESTIGWTDDPSIVDPTKGTFAVIYFPAPKTVTGVAIE